MSPSTPVFAAPRQDRVARASAFALACLFTLGTMLFIHTLAEVDEQSPQWAQHSTQPRA